jgi:NAD(P)-dependent dehydrogenase (short-subunit alcohol dehydrogenase family)
VNAPASVPAVASLLNFRGKVVIVTGSGSGLGGGIARRFGEAGAAVVVHYGQSAEGAQTCADAIVAAGGTAITAQADVTQSDAVESLFEQTVARFGQVDVLVNNAGIYPMRLLTRMSLAEWDAVLNANLRSVFLCTQAAAKHMSAGSAIVNITSIEAENPAPQHAHYDAAKAAVAMFTKNSAVELAAKGIRVNAVAPGLIWREGIEQGWPDGVDRFLNRAPLKRLGMPEDVGDACLFLASPGARWITGASLTVDGGVLCAQVY